MKETAIIEKFSQKAERPTHGSSNTDARSANDRCCIATAETFCKSDLNLGEWFRACGAASCEGRKPEP